MVLATTGSPELAEAALRRLGLWQCFRGLITTTELGTSKREPLIYKKAAELLGKRESLFEKGKGSGEKCRVIIVDDIP